MSRKLLAMLLFISYGFRCPQSVPVSPDKYVMQVAENQLNQYLAKIPPGQDSAYGFVAGDNPEDCEIAKPYRLLIFSDDFYSDSVAEGVNYLVIKNEWRAPVRLTGQDRMLLSVSGNPANLSVTAMGDTGLARELQQKSFRVDTASGFYLLRVPVINADFFVADHDNSFAEAKFMPLSSAIAAIPSYGKNKQNSYTLDEVERTVKDAIRKQRMKKPASKKAAPVKNKSKKIKLQTQE